MSKSLRAFRRPVPTQDPHDSVASRLCKGAAWVYELASKREDLASEREDLASEREVRASKPEALTNFIVSGGPFFEV